MAMTSLESQKLFQKFRISMQVHQYLILASPHAMRDVFSVCKYIYLPDIKHSRIIQLVDKKIYQ